MKRYLLLSVLCFSCGDQASVSSQLDSDGGSTFTCGDHLLDQRDNKSYRTVLIGNQCWMADNLDYGQQISGLGSKKEPCPSLEKGTVKKFCYDDSADSCSSLGALYCWEQASQIKWEEASNSKVYQGLCPTGWRLPSNSDFAKLTAQYTGQDLLIGGDSNFEMALSGYRYRGGRYDDYDRNGRLWSTYRPGHAGSPGGKGANFLHLSPYGTSLQQQKYDQAFSVRCILADRTANGAPQTQQPSKDPNQSTPDKSPEPSLPSKPGGSQNICEESPMVNQSLDVVYDEACLQGGPGCVAALPCRYTNL